MFVIASNRIKKNPFILQWLRRACRSGERQKIFSVRNPFGKLRVLLTCCQRFHGCFKHVFDESGSSRYPGVHELDALP